MGFSKEFDKSQVRIINAQCADCQYAICEADDNRFNEPHGRGGILTLLYVCSREDEKDFICADA